MNKRGFTLIELLAVIVILAIIALIATPIVLNVINTAQDGANKRSVEGYMKAWESAYYQSKLGSNPAASISSVATSSIEYSGAVVSCTGVSMVDNQINAASCTVNGANYSYNSKTGAAKI